MKIKKNIFSLFLFTITIFTIFLYTILSLIQNFLTFEFLHLFLFLYLQLVKFFFDL